jgi:TfoX/Sxy family transcriptional regulator of competence genes
MGYDEGLVERVRALLEGKPGFSEKKMFGGVCFLLRGNMACGVLNDDLIVRAGPEKYKDLLALAETREFDMTGKPMKGWVMVSPEGHRTQEKLVFWVEQGVAFTLTLPAK